MSGDANTRDKEGTTNQIHCLDLKEEEVLRLPYCGPPARRIYIISHGETVGELFVQRRDAFTTNLISLMSRLKAHEISEIRYTCGIDGVMRIHLGDKGNLAGEYTCRTKKCVEDIRSVLGLGKPNVCDNLT